MLVSATLDDPDLWLRRVLRALVHDAVHGACGTIWQRVTEPRRPARFPSITHDGIQRSVSTCGSDFLPTFVGAVPLARPHATE